MLTKRVLSAVVGVPLLLYLAYRGGVYLLLTVFILMVLALGEFRNIGKKALCKSLDIPLWISAILFPVFYLLHNHYLVNLIFFYLLFCYVYFLLNYPKYSPLDLSFTLFGVVYIVWGFFHLVLLRQLADGFWLIIYVLLIVWSTDTGAYFIGTLMGKHKFAPLISPKKSWEGVFGGLVVSLLTAYLFVFLVPVFSVAEKSVLLYITPFVSLIGQMGDLMESALKRFADMKDSGQIIPGHGGVLDRFDSLLLAAPFTYYLFILLERLL